MNLYTVWLRGDGYIGYSAYVPASRKQSERPFDVFEILFQSPDWDTCASRVHTERTAACMNEDLWPFAPSAEGNRVGVYI